MTKNSISNKGMPEEVKQELLHIGEAVKIARKRRNLTQTELAQMLFVTTGTVVRLEKGDQGLSLSIVLTALYCLQLDFQVSAHIAPEKDRIGMALDIRKHGERKQVRKTHPPSLDF